MATLLIGGNGLIGSGLVKYLCEAGEEVNSFSSHEPAKRIPGCTYVQGDVTEYGTINMILKNYPIDRILHNALCPIPNYFGITPIKFTEST